MFRVKITYESGNADIGDYGTEAEARAVVAAVTLRMNAGEGIADVASWEA